MVNKLLKLYFLFLPLHVFGYAIGGYVFTIPTILSLLIVISYILKLNKRFEFKILIPFLLFIFWALLSVLYNDLGWSWINSMAALILMSLPVFFKYNSKQLSGLTKYIIFGFFLTIPFSIYDLLVTLFNIQPIGQGSEFFHYSQGGIVDGYYRIRATFDEPSFYAIYLCAMLSFIIGTKYQKNKYLFYSIIVLIILTLSLTGYVLLVYLLYFHTSLKNKAKVKHVFILIVFLLLYSLLFQAQLGHIYNRIKNSFTSILEFNVLGSEGPRLNSLIVLLRYYQDERTNIYFGEGYSNYENWLIDNFSSYDPIRVPFARGTIHNLFAVIGISTGIVGLILYLIIFIAMYRNKIIDKDSLILILLIQFAYTQIVGYLIWGILLIFRYKATALQNLNLSEC
jgi:O-antigen ligase